MILISLETKADVKSQWLMPKIEPDSRLKDPEKIEASIKEKSKKQLDDMKYVPYAAQVLCVSTYDTDTKEDKTFINLTSEKETLSQILKEIKDEDVCTYCSWEIEFIIKRAIFHGLASYFDLVSWRKRFKDTTSLDLKKLFEFYQNDTTFNLLAGAYAKEQIEDFDNARTNMPNEEHIEYVTGYCVRKMNILKKIYETIS